MPRSIIVASIAVSVMVAGRIILSLLIAVSGANSLLRMSIPVAIAILILVGIIKGHRLAWQWGRILGMISAVLLTVITLGVFVSNAPWNGKIIAGTFLLVQAIALYILFFALGTGEAKKYFGLICPQCGMETSKSANFLFTKAVCKQCSTKW